MSRESHAGFDPMVTVRHEVDEEGVLRRLFDSDPADNIVAGKLEALYRARNQPQELLEVVLTRAEVAETTAQQIGLLREAAAIFRSLGDVEGARQTLATAFASDRTNIELANELDEVTLLTDQWVEVADAYMCAALRYGDKPIAEHLWLRVAALNIANGGDPTTAGAVLQRVTEVDPTQGAPTLDIIEESARTPDVLRSFADLCRRIGDEERTASALARALVMTEGDADKAALLHELAELHLHCGDLDAAEWNAAEALRVDASRQDTHRLLVDLHQRRGDTRGAAELLAERAAHEGGDAGRVAFEAASLYEELDENTRAVDLYALTVEANPHHVTAAVKLAERYYKKERWAELEPLLSLIIERPNERPEEAPSTAELHFRAGVTASKLGKHGAARRHFTATLQHEPDRDEALQALAIAERESGHLTAALKSFEALVSRQLEAKRLSAAADTFYEIGATHRQAGQRDVAVPVLERAIDLVPEHDGAHETLKQIFDDRGDVNKSIRLSRRRMKSAKGALKIKLMLEIADKTSHQLRDKPGATKLYEQVLDEDSKNLDALHQLVDLYSDAKRWREAVDSILRIAKLEKKASRRGKCFEAAAAIAKHELVAIEAIRHYNSALDCFYEDPNDPSSETIKPFTEIVKLLYDEERFVDLERNYRRMIRRMRPEDPALAQLWQDLAHIRRQHPETTKNPVLSDTVGGLSGGDADDGEAGRNTLLDFYDGAGNDEIDKAIERRLRLVDDNATSAEHYGALFNLFNRTGQMDQAFCAARAAVFLGRAEAEQKIFFQQHRKQTMAWPKQALSPAQWSLLRPETEDPRLTTLFTVIAETVLAGSTTSPPSPNPSQDYHRNLAEWTSYFLAAPGFASITLSDGGRDSGLSVQQQGLSLTIGEAARQETRLEGAVCHLARVIAFARPSYLMRGVLSDAQEAEALLYAALSICGAQINPPAHLIDRVEPHRAALNGRLQPAMRAQLASAAQPLIMAGDASWDVDIWWQQVSFVGRRAALLLTGDLEVAARGITSGTMEAQLELRDLLSHSISDQHAQLRQELGVSCLPSRGE